MHQVSAKLAKSMQGDDGFYAPIQKCRLNEGWHGFRSLRWTFDQRWVVDGA
jgi:hypothetical protein